MTKILKGLFLFTLVLTTSLSIVAQDGKDSKKNDKETVVLDVSMSCQKCKKKIEKNIPFEKGITALNVYLDTKTVKVEFKKKDTSIENLIEAFEKLGYEATVREEAVETTE